jgi:tetratricopeptide (TPR) repeat protein
VLDNAETPWEGDRAGMKALFQRLVQLPSLALVASMRGREPPDLDLIHPAELEVTRLKAEESLEQFCSIARGPPRDHPLLRKLLKAQEGVALAVKLLALEVRSTNLGLVWKRWQQRKSKILDRDPDRGSSLSISIGLSFDSPRLTDVDRRFFSVLALLPAGASDADCESFFDGALDCLSHLQKSALVENENGRWRILAPIREYVLRRGANPSDREHVVTFYFRMAHQLGPQMGRPRGGEALRQLTVEIDNLEALLELEWEQGDGLRATETALTLNAFIRFSGHGSARPLEKALELARQQGDTRRQAHCLLELARLHFLRRPRYDLAQERLQEALALFTQEDDLAGRESCLRELGHIAASEGRLERAREYFEQALAIHDHLQDPSAKAYCLHGLARVARFQGRTSDALHLFKETLRMFTGTSASWSRMKPSSPRPATPSSP